MDRLGAPEGWLEGAPDAVGCPKASLMVMMRSKTVHLCQYRGYDGGVGKGCGPPQREGLACLASARRRDRVGVFCAIVICDIEVKGGEDFDGYSLFFRSDFWSGSVEVLVLVLL